MRMIGVLDYGIGNIGSILNMLKKVGVKAQPVTTGEALSTCDRLILPGVGAFDQGDRLLGWQDRQDSFRYCHHFSGAEIDALAASVAGRAHPIARFRADGRSGDLNDYLVLQV